MVDEEKFLHRAAVSMSHGLCLCAAFATVGRRQDPSPVVYVQSTPILLKICLLPSRLPSPTPVRSTKVAPSCLRYWVVGVPALHFQDVRADRMLVGRINPGKRYPTPDLVPGYIHPRGCADVDRGQVVGHVLPNHEGQMGALHQREATGHVVILWIRRD